jgi:hypothetical protein
MKTEYQLKKERFIKEQNDKLRELINHPDTEVAHYEADLILCDILKEFGCEETVRLWESVEKWYA